MIGIKPKFWKPNFKLGKPKGRFIYNGPIWSKDYPHNSSNIKKNYDINMGEKDFKRCKECGCLTYKERCEYCDKRTTTS